jgi:hypothetical protein
LETSQNRKFSIRALGTDIGCKSSLNLSLLEFFFAFFPARDPAHWNKNQDNVGSSRRVKHIQSFGDCRGRSFPLRQKPLISGYQPTIEIVCYALFLHARFTKSSHDIFIWQIRTSSDI